MIIFHFTRLNSNDEQLFSAHFGTLSHTTGQNAAKVKTHSVDQPLVKQHCQILTTMGLRNGNLEGENGKRSSNKKRRVVC